MVTQSLPPPEASEQTQVLATVQGPGVKLEWVADPFSSLPAEPERTCCRCGAGFNKADVRKGRGRHLGEHPSHDHAPCGCDVDFFGYRLTATGCRLEIYRGIHRMDEAALLEVRALPRFNAQVLPLSICAEFNLLGLLRGDRYAADYLRWCIHERLKAEGVQRG